MMPFAPGQMSDDYSANRGGSVPSEGNRELHSIADVGHAAIRVVVMSSVRFYREGLAQLLASQGIDVAGASAFGPSALETTLAQAPNLVLIDISTSDGIAGLRALAERAPQIRTVALAVSESDREVFECVQAGVAGYVTRDASLEEIVTMLTSVAKGELRCPPLVATILRRRLASLASHEADVADLKLTLREREIMCLVARAFSNKEIARRLNIEVSTVKSHVHSIFEKLGVRRRSEAIDRLRGGHWPGAGSDVPLSAPQP